MGQKKATEIEPEEGHLMQMKGIHIFMQKAAF